MSVHVLKVVCSLQVLRLTHANKVLIPSKLFTKVLKGNSRYS